MNTLLKNKWVRFSSILVLAGGMAFGVSALVHQHNSGSMAIAESLSPELRQVTSFRSPTCGCCGAWVKHMQAAGFEVKDNVTQDMAGIKREHNVPRDLVSCHTALVGGYVVEGHIPAADIQKLLIEKPDVVGIAVPGMPIGSPGMESGNIKEPYQVLAFDEAGQTKVFAEYF